jgi:succinate-semialdehyde dehydrogenase/glutarate-semialdehyde dehydrogenase
MTYQSVNPFNGEKSETFAELSDATLEERIGRADHCFRADWRRRTVHQRAAIVGKVAALMRERAEELARLITVEMGKGIKESRWEVGLSADIFDYYAQQGPAFLAPRKLDVESGSALLESEPLGVLFGVEPWNFPYYQLARFAAPNLVAGNVLLVKHSSIVPRCALAFEKVLRDGGVPEGSYGNLFVSKTQIETIIADPRIRGVALTGSEEAGQSVAKLAGASLKKTTMELGGSDAFIVLDDADIALAVKQAVAGRFNNAGQSCVAAKRFIVLEAVAKRFLDGFTKATEALVVGDPLDESTTLAPRSSPSSHSSRGCSPGSSSARA